MQYPDKVIIESAKSNYLQMIFRISLFSLIFLITFSACEDDDNTLGKTWELTWEDNFEGEEGLAPNPNNWVYDLGRGPNGDGWGNAELQVYTDEPENVSLDGQGNLAITALSSGGYTSGRIKTLGKFEQRYGRFEASIKLPYGKGIWPAFWLLGSNIETVDWPQCGEIDIMEMRGQNPNIINGTVHGPGYYGSTQELNSTGPVSGSFGFENARFDEGFHLFAIEWGEDYINFLVDDVAYLQITPEDVSGEWVFDQPFFILLNVAVGGTYVGFPAQQTPFPQTMLVDWVKVYKEVNTE